MLLLWYGLLQCFSKFNVPLRILLKCRCCFHKSDWAVAFCNSNKLAGDSYVTCQGPYYGRQGLDRRSLSVFHLTLRYLTEKLWVTTSGICSFLLDLSWTLAPKILTSETNSASGNNISIFCIYGFDYYQYFIQVESKAISL